MKQAIKLWANVIHLYTQGYTEKEILDLRGKLDATNLLWRELKQQTANRWLNSARDADPDADILHLLNRRKRKPGLVTKPDLTSEKHISLARSRSSLKAGLQYEAGARSDVGETPVIDEAGARLWRLTRVSS